jgi:hypothetical protein
MARSQVSSEVDSDRVLPTKRILQVWWPLAASWALMALEGPAISAIVARLADPEVHLAAYGGIVFPLALFIAAPIIMLLAASTALSVDDGRRTRSITEAVGIFLLVCVAILWTGVRTHWFAGIYVGLVALSVGEFLRTAWLAWRSREIRKALAERDAVFNAVKD